MGGTEASGIPEMDDRTIWIVAPDPALRRLVKEILGGAGLHTKALKRVARRAPWRGEDTVIISADLLPLEKPPAVVVALVPPENEAIHASAVTGAADWHVPQDPCWLAHLPAVVEALQCRGSRWVRQEFYQRVLEQMEEGAVIENAEGRFTFASPRALEMLGYSSEELLGLHYTQIVHPGDVEEALESASKRRDGIAGQYEARLVHRDGSVVPAWVSATPLFDEDQFVGVLATFRDISREKGLQKRFRALERVAAAVGDAANLEDVFRRTQEALRILIDGALDVLFFMVDGEGETLRPLALQHERPPAHVLSKVLNKPISELRFPLAMLPSDWSDRIPTGQPCVSLDAVELARQTLGPKVAEVVPRMTGTRALLGLPLRSGGLLRGIILVTLEHRHVYQEDLDLAMAVANVVASALESSILLEQARHRMYSLDRLFELTRAMAASTEPYELAAIAAKQFILALDVEEASISLWDQEENVLQTIVDLYHDEDTGTFEPGHDPRTYPLEDFPATLKVLESRQPLQVLLGDASIDPHELTYLREAGSRTLVVLPLVHKGHSIGVVELEDSRKEQRLAPDQMNLAMTLAGQVAAAMENARLVTEARRRAVQLETAAEVAQHASGILEVDTLLAQTAESIHEGFGLYYVGIFLTDESGEWAVLHAGTGEAGQAMLDAGHELEVGESSMVGWCIAHGQARIALDVGQEAVRFDNPLLPRTRSEMALPLVSRGQVIGAMTIQSDQPTAFSEVDIAVLQTTASQLANAIENARLFHEANRRAERLTLVNRIARAVSATLDLDDLVETVYQEVANSFEVDAFFIALYDQETNEVDYRLKIDEGVREPKHRQPMQPGPTGYVITQRSPLLVRHLELEKDRVPQPIRLWGSMRPPASWLGVPMSIGDRVVGVISVQAYRPNAYGEEEQLLLSTVADQIAVAAENARLYADARQRAEELTALNAVAARLGQSLDLQEVLDAAMEEVARVLSVEASAVSLVNPEEGALVLQAQRGLRYDHRGMRIPAAQGLSGQVVRTGKVLITGDVEGDPRLAVPSFARERIRAMALIPMHSRGQVVGVLSAMSHSSREFTEREVSLLQAVANQVGTAVENAQLYQAVKEYAADLERAYARLKEADQVKDELIQNVSHELRTPLTFLKGYVQLLMEEELGPLNQEQRRSLEVVARKTTLLNRLVGDMVTLETAREAALDLAPVDLGQLARAALEGCQPLAARSGIELREEIPENLPRVMADRDRIGEVFYNLLHNAVKFSPGGGTITVRMTAQEEGYVQIEVSDTGIGIPEEKLDRIFDRFYQVDGSSRRRFGGVGLGLAIVKQIVEAHGGQVTARSRVGEGSAFQFSLPSVPQ
jgi:PAS domain S-box-containing protein